MYSQRFATPDTAYQTLLLLSLILLLITSWNAPISGDEYVHVKQAEKNISYIKSLGKDKEALDTPISRLKHYGQSVDTVTTYIAQVLNVNDLYRFRHICNATIGWLTILFASLITLKITRSKIAAIISIILFLVSLRFVGHSMNNLKDIPFAFALIFSLYFMLRFFENLPKISWIDLVMTTQGLAIAISIRIGGLLILAYFILFAGFFTYFLVVTEKIEIGHAIKIGFKIGLLSIAVFFLAYFSAILIWPWALENPLKNPWISLELMHHYPTTIRQIFEGKLIWSDQFPWYYLFKYLLITLPIVAILGFVMGLIFVWKLKNNQSTLFSIFILIAVGFPLFYASTSGANVYGGWRQMLFIFPPLVVFSAIGLWKFWCIAKSRSILKVTVYFIFAILLFAPVRYFILNYPYQYTFFNQLTGGFAGAYGNYELDYYFTSFQKAYEFIDDQADQPAIVAANFIIPEYYKGKAYKAKLMDYYDRSSIDWDYAIVCNAFLDPYQLRNGIWPPSNTVFTEDIFGKPILAVLKRDSRDGLVGKRALDQGEFETAVKILEKALASDQNNESIRLNLARAYIAVGYYSKAQLTLDQFCMLYPDNEWANELRGEIEMNKGNIEQAAQIFKRNIAYNSKFYHSYISLANAYISLENRDEATRQLKSCLRINPFYEPAYKLYGRLLIEDGQTELGSKMLEYSIDGNSKYGRK